MLVELNFDVDAINKAYEDRGVSFSTEKVIDDGTEIELYSYTIDPKHEFWVSKKFEPNENKTIFAIKETKGIFWSYNLDHSINDYFVDNVTDSFCMFNRKTGTAYTRKESRNLYSIMDDETRTEEEQDNARNEFFAHSMDAYGTADNVQQVLERFERVIANPDIKVVFGFNNVYRENQSESGGWRWHKNGEYIGNQKPTHEYLYDDTHIDKIIQFHVYVIE